MPCNKSICSSLKCAWQFYCLHQWMPPLSKNETSLFHVYIENKSTSLGGFHYSMAPSLVGKIIIFNHSSDSISSTSFCLILFASSWLLWQHSSRHFNTIVHQISPLSVNLLSHPTWSFLPPPLIHPSLFCLLAYLKGDAVILLSYSES